MRNAVSAIIRSWGATVVASREPSQEFISRMVTEAQDGNLAALLSDYNLGEGVMTGLEAIFAVRIGAARNFPCVLLTAVSEDVIARAYRTLVLNPDNEGQAMPVILQKPAGAEALASPTSSCRKPKNDGLKNDVKTGSASGDECFGAVACAEGSINGRDVRFDRAFRQIQFAADALNGKPARKRAQYVLLALRQMDFGGRLWQAEG